MKQEDRIDEVATFIAAAGRFAAGAAGAAARGMGAAARVAGRAAGRQAKKAAIRSVKRKAVDMAREKFSSEQEEEPQMENNKMSYKDKISYIIEKRSRGVGPAKTNQTSQQKAMGESPAQFRMATAENIVDKRGKIKMTRAERKRRAKELLQGRSNQRSSIEDSFVYAYNVWSIMLAEAGRKLGPIAQRYEGAKVTGITDPRLRKAAKREKARIEKKLGIKTNPDAGQLVQQHQERRRRQKRKAIGLDPEAGLPPETPDIARADREEDKRKMRGDR